MSIQDPGRPARQRPPLLQRLRLAHWIALDVIAAAVFTVLLTFAVQHGISARGTFISPANVAVAFVLAVAMCLPVALRRLRPLLAFGSALATATLVTLLVPLANAPYFYLPAGYVLYLVAATSRRKVALAALGTLVVLIVFQELRMAPVTRAGTVVPMLLIVIIIWTFGYAVGQRRAYAVQLRDQAATSAVTEERLRIARELHDVVAHSMTVIAVQAGYGRHVIDAQPERAEEALGAIQATSREALAEMRRMLGILRQPGAEPFGRMNGSASGTAADTGGVPAGGERGATGPADTVTGGAAASNGSAGVSRGAAPLMPAPGLAELDRLVARVANAGVWVDLRVQGSRPELPPGIDLSAFRIVQEALTNVVKHAGTSSCQVTVCYGADELAVEITDEGRGCPVPAASGPGGEAAEDLAGGHGLIGMRERVSMYGGELVAGPLPGQGFRVAARLPIADPAA